MARKTDYTTVTEKAEAAFEEKLESLPTKREKREVLEEATAKIEAKEAEQKGAPVVVQPNPFKKGKA